MKALVQKAYGPPRGAIPNLIIGRRRGPGPDRDERSLQHLRVGTSGTGMHRAPRA